MTSNGRPVDTVVFDIDGTLVDSTYQHTLAWSRAFRSVDVEVPCAVIHRAIGMGGDRLVAAVAGRAVEHDHGDAVRASWEKEYDAMLEEPTALPGAAALLRDLHEQGLQVVLASSAIPRHAQRSIGLLGDAAGHADAMTSSEDAQESKPDPELLDTAIERVGGSSSLVVGDSVWDVEAAQRLGIPCVALLSGGFGAGELREAGALRVLKDAEELRQHLSEILAGAS